MPNKPYEVIVIGSGATGGVAALTLAKEGVKVLVIEAGPKYSAKQALGSEPTNTFNRLRGIIDGNKKIQSQHPGYWKSNPMLFANEKESPYSYPFDKPFLWTQGRQVGGRSLTWGGITLRLSDNDLKPSREDGYGQDWPIDYAEIAPHYSEIEKLFQVHGNKDGLEQLPDGEFLDPLPFTKIEEEFGKRIQTSLEYPFIHSRGFGPHIPNIDGNWPLYSSPGSTLKAAIATGKVEVLPNHIAEKLTFNKSGDLTSGVITVNKSDGSRERFSSNLIVICASTIQSLRLLLSSERKHQQNGFVDPSDKLGLNLMDHISTCRFFTIPKIGTNKSNQILSGAGSFFIPFGSKLAKTSKTEFIRGYGIWGGIDRFEPPAFLKRIPGTNTGFLIGHGEVLASLDNKVVLSTKLDQWGIPIPHISFQWGQNEKNMVKHMNLTINEIIESSGGKSLPLKKIVRMPFVDNFLEKNSVVLKEEAPPPGYYIHEVGGAPMGTKEENSVLDRFNRLWRCPNVLVVDGACWPTSSWQSPTLTMMALTRRACLEALKPQNDQRDH